VDCFVAVTPSLRELVSVEEHEAEASRKS